MEIYNRFKNILPINAEPTTVNDRESMTKSTTLPEARRTTAGQGVENQLSGSGRSHHCMTGTVMVTTTVLAIVTFFF